MVFVSSMTIEGKMEIKKAKIKLLAILGRVYPSTINSMYLNRF